MNNSHELSPEQRLTTFEPTPEGLGAMVDMTIANNVDAIRHKKASRRDDIGITGGDTLTLYPNPNNARETIYAQE